jgi:hypothetical protein
VGESLQRPDERTHEGTTNNNNNNNNNNAGKITDMVWNIGQQGE